MELSQSTYYYFAVKMLMYILYFAGMLGLFQSAPDIQDTYIWVSQHSLVFI